MKKRNYKLSKLKKSLMKIFFIVPFLFFFSCKLLQASSKTEFVRIYMGTGSNPTSCGAWGKRIRAYVQEKKIKCDFAFVSSFSEIIQDIKTHKNGLLVIPGGSASSMRFHYGTTLKSQGLDHKNLLKLFLSNHWSYLGCCAGAYFAARSFSVDLVILEGKGDTLTEDQRFFRSLSFGNRVNLELFPDHLHSLFPFKAGVGKEFYGARALECKETGGHILWHGGPNLNTVSGEKFFTSTKGDTLAIKASSPSEGSIVLLSVHPEFEPETLAYLSRKYSYHPSELKKHDPRGSPEKSMISRVLSEFF